jgi:Icc-related predicted phosphoesterase
MMIYANETPAGMRILLLSDLHSRLDWYQWAAAQRAGLTAIAGDLLDGFQAYGLLPQITALKKWADAFPGPLAVSSGNHDGNIEAGALSGELAITADREAALALLASENWMDALERPGVVTDRRSQILDTAAGMTVITTTPYFPGPQGPRFCDRLWEEGKRLRTATGRPWLVLHHEPPADTMVGGRTGDPSLFYQIQEYQPDFVLSGHIHGQPYAGSFADRLGKTWCFNPGFPVLARAIRTRVPNHIILDLAAGTATWHATPNVGRQPILKQISLI